MSLERIEYTAYGLALHHPPADITGDRLVDSADQQAITNNPSMWGVGDLNHDGVVNRADQALVLAGWASTALPPGRLSKTDNVFGFTGQIYNQEVGAYGAYLYRMRWYDAVLGQFLSRDPAGYIDGMLLYAYVSGNPMVFVDPLGLSLWDVCEQWWNDSINGIDSLINGESEHHSPEYYRDLNAKHAARQEALVEEGRMTQAEVDAHAAGLEESVGVVEDADTDLDQAKVEFVATATFNPAVMTGAAIANATVDVAQGQYAQAALGVVPGAGAEIAAKASGKLVGAGMKSFAKGQAGEETAEGILKAQGYEVTGKNVTFDTPGGRVRTDRVARKDGDLYVVESKNGPHARLTPNQAAAYPTAGQAAWIPRGANAAEARLPVGKPITPKGLISFWFNLP
jgi:RHS repeat-associated protein